MLEMPLEDSTLPKSREIGPSAAAEMQKMKPAGNNGSNFLFGHGHLMNYATHRNEQSLNGSSTMTAIGSSPLDQLIKLHERFQQGEFSASSSSSSAALSASSFSLSTSKSPISIGVSSSATVKTPPAVINPIPLAPPASSAFDHFGTAFGCSTQSLLDPSSLVFSSYTAATNAAAQLAPTSMTTMAAAAAAAAAPWSSPAACWSWNAAAAASETTAAAALLTGGGGGGGSPNGAAGWSAAAAGQHYFGNAFGAAAAGLVPTQFSTTAQIGPSPNNLETAKNLLTMHSPAAASKNGTKQTLQKMSSKRSSATLAALNNGKQRELPAESRPTAGARGNKIAATTTTNGRGGQRANGGGKMRGTAVGNGGNSSSSVGGAKMTCECPNCKELQRIGAPLDKKREKHSCHIPGCHKVYSRSSHLKAHLRWHSTDRPATTKRRLFDPPEGPILAGSLLRNERAEKR